MYKKNELFYWKGFIFFLVCLFFLLLMFFQWLPSLLPAEKVPKSRFLTEESSAHSASENRPEDYPCTDSASGVSELRASKVKVRASVGPYLIRPLGAIKFKNVTLTFDLQKLKEYQRREKEQFPTSSNSFLVGLQHCLQTPIKKLGLPWIKMEEEGLIILIDGLEFTFKINKEKTLIIAAGKAKIITPITKIDFTQGFKLSATDNEVLISEKAVLQGDDPSLFMPGKYELGTDVIPKTGFRDTFNITSTGTLTKN